eukprot:scaffold323457_cov86-Attheya_sp.AAC.2
MLHRVGLGIFQTKLLNNSSSRGWNRGVIFFNLIANISKQENCEGSGAPRDWPKFASICELL